MRRTHPGLISAIAVIAAIAIALIYGPLGTGSNIKRDRSVPPEISAEPTMPLTESDEGSVLSTRFQAIPRSIVHSGQVFFLGQDVPTYASGNLLVALERERETSAPFQMAVTRGSWTVDAPPRAFLQVYSGTLDGVQVWPVLPQLALEEETVLTVTVDSRPFVWIVDGEAGKQIEAVSALFMPPSPEPFHPGTLPHPGFFGEGPGLELLTTPILTADLESPGVTLFTAEGFTWGSLCLARGSRTSATISLDPAGALRVVVSDGAEQFPGECWLRMFDVERPAKTRPLYSIPFLGDGNEFSLFHVREGNYLVELVRNPDTSIESQLFTSEVRINRGLESSIQITLDPPNNSKPTPVFFLLVGEEDALAEVTSFVIRPVRVASPTEVELVRVQALADVTQRAEGVREFEPQNLFPGSYRIEVKPHGHIELVSIPADEIYLHEINLAPMEDYTLEVRDAASGLPVDVWVSLVLSTANPEIDLSKLPPRGQSLTFEGGHSSFRAERGRLRVWLSSHEFGSRYFELDGRSRRDFHVVLEKPPTVRLRATSRGIPILLPVNWWTGIQTYSGSGERERAFLEFDSTSVSGWYSEAQWTPERTGGFVIHLPPPPGSSAPLQLELQAGSGQSVAVIDLCSGGLLR